MGLVDPDYKTKYKHLFRDRRNTSKSFFTEKNHIADLLHKFNNSVDHIFFADSRVLIPAEESGSLPRHGIIIEHIGKSNSQFEEDFDKYESEIQDLAKSLDSTTCLYEYSFKTEFKKDKWVEFENKKVAYNLAL